MGALIGFIGGVLFIIGALMTFFGAVCVNDERNITRQDHEFDKRSVALLVSGLIVVVISILVTTNGYNYKSEEEACALAGRQWMSQSCIAITE